jgi:uncharacterized membrane protein
MPDHENTFLAVLAGSWKLLASLIGSITLMQFQAVLGICSTLVVMGYTLWKWRREAKAKQE